MNGEHVKVTVELCSIDPDFEVCYSYRTPIDDDDCVFHQSGFAIAECIKTTLGPHALQVLANAVDTSQSIFDDYRDDVDAEVFRQAALDYLKTIKKPGIKDGSQTKG